MVREKEAASAQLKVAEAKQRDVGKGRARIWVDTLEALNLVAGDIVEIIGKKSTVATAWPADSEDQWSGIVRIDGQTRKNAGIALNDYVILKKSVMKDATNITLVPVSGKVTLDKEFAQFVGNRLRGFPLMQGDDISILILGNPIVFNVAKVNPKGIVRMNHGTRLSIVPEATIDRMPEPRITYEEIGGLKDEINRLREIVELPLRHPELFQKLGIEPPNGILLYGPPGCGKTLLAKALANESEANIFTVNGPEVMNKYYGETEAKLRELFKEAKENAPSILFIDEIDAIVPKREEVFGDVEKRVVAQILALMDGMSERGDVIVIGATNRPDSVDPALRRPGRFDREVEIGVPNVEDRFEVLLIHTRGMPLSKDIDLKNLAGTLHGYTGADLRALCREAALEALRRYLPGIDVDKETIPPEMLERIEITNQDFTRAYKEIIPTALREFYVETPSTTWNDVGGLDDLKKTLRENVVWAVKYPDRFHRVGVKPPRGVLIYGPPGCGKTLIAKALASESGANLISIRGPEILSKWVGESEKAIREIFRKAKAASPCIVFFDEIDSVARTRSFETLDSGVGERILSQLLTEMDGIQDVGGVFVIGVTNRPDLLDLSLLRPGRFDLILYAPTPNEIARFEILRITTSRMPLNKDVSLEEIAGKTKGYSGADIESVVREVGIAALKRNLDEPIACRNDFEYALTKVTASITQDVETWYKAIQEKMANRLPKRLEKEFYG
jgi:transitional endoplasmic reticulum ATPase